MDKREVKQIKKILDIIRISVYNIVTKYEKGVKYDNQR